MEPRAGTAGLPPAEGPCRRLVQDLARDAVDGGRHLGLLLVGEVRELAAQPGQLGVGELPDARVQRGDDGRGAGLVLPVEVRRGLGRDDGGDLRDLARPASARAARTWLASTIGTPAPAAVTRMSPPARA